MLIFLVCYIRADTVRNFVGGVCRLLLLQKKLDTMDSVHATSAEYLQIQGTLERLKLVQTCVSKLRQLLKCKDNKEGKLLSFCAKAYEEVIFLIQLCKTWPHVQTLKSWMQ